ncbi:MAG: alkene reductase [Candidatus Cloacimonetes bacterium]|nr:alkene reductase [Candidatus Cloacimonadota bacterium]
MNEENLFQKYKLSDSLELNNRIIMAPLTRCFASEDLVPNKLAIPYYEKRADAGLIISEATLIRKDGQGYPGTPGIYTQSQIDAWSEITKAVHQKGGKIFLQLWHCGRVAHTFYTNQPTLAPSAVKVEGRVPRTKDLQYEMPKELQIAEIKQLVVDYQTSAKNAIQAGFDGVEIHGANGYLIDQFLHYSSNTRADSYGGNPKNMSRFCLEVIDAICSEIGSDKVGIRLSPAAYFNMDTNPLDPDVFKHLLSEIDKRNLAYIHSGIFDDSVEYDYLEGNVTSFLRKNYKGTVIGAGSYTKQSASLAISEHKMDLIAFGRPFIANSDLVEKLKTNQEITPYTDVMLMELV